MVLIYRIDSRDREVHSPSNTDFTINTIPIHAKVIRVKHIVIPNLFNNIRASPSADANSTFSYEIGGVPTTIVVPDGYYSIDELITYINTELGEDFTISYNSISGFISIENMAGLAFDVLTSASGNIMADVLGISTDTTINIGETAIFGHKPNLYNYNVVYIASRKLSNSFNVIAAGGRYPIIATVPINAPYGAIVSHEVNEQHPIEFEASTNIEDIDLQIVNHRGEVIYLPGNHHVQVLVEIEGRG